MQAGQRRKSISAKDERTKYRDCDQAFSGSGSRRKSQNQFGGNQVLLSLRNGGTGELMECVGRHFARMSR